MDILIYIVYNIYTIKINIIIMRTGKELSEMAKMLSNRYKPQIADWEYLDQVIIHDCEWERGWNLNLDELQYIKTYMQMIYWNRKINTKNNNIKNGKH